MKKFLFAVSALILTASMLFTLSACTAVPQQHKQPDNPNSQENQQENPDNPNEKQDEQINEQMPDPEFIYDHVVIIGVDGAGAFFKKTDTPNVDRIFENAAKTYEAITTTPSISGPAWGSLLCGVKPEFHHMTNGSISEEHPLDSEYPSVFRIVREKYPDAVLASFCNYNAINIGIIENGIDVHKETGEDDIITSNILTYLDTTLPKLLFVQFDSVDAAGHDDGFGLDKYLKQITTVDGFIGQIYDKYEALGIADSTLFIVTADHGGTVHGSHGGTSEAEMKIFIGAKGKNVVNGTIGDCEIRDIAAITAYALGVTIPNNWSGKVPANLFEGVKTITRKEFEPPIAENRKHETVETPDLFSGKYLTDILGKNNCKLILPFDGDISDIMGNYDTDSAGKLYFSPGYHGECATFDDGFMTVTGLKLGKGSFSIGTWIKSMIVGYNGIICGTKDDNRCSRGMEIQIGLGYCTFIFGDGFNFRFAQDVFTPDDTVNGWMHIIFTVDKEKGKLTAYCDFEKLGEFDIPEEVMNISANGVKFNIGQNSMNNEMQLAASLDDFIIYDGVITDEQVAKLKTYYGK